MTRDQLYEQLLAEREQHAFVEAAKENEIASLLREMMRQQVELARLYRINAFAAEPSPSEVKH